MDNKDKANQEHSWDYYFDHGFPPNLFKPDLEIKLEDIKPMYNLTSREFTSLSLGKKMDLYKETKLRLNKSIVRCPSQVTKCISRYSYWLRFKDGSGGIPANITLFDHGMDLYTTDRARRRLHRAIQKEAGWITNEIEISF